MIVLSSETYCWYNEQSDTVILARKEINKNSIEELLAKYRKKTFLMRSEYIQPNQDSA